MISIRTDFRQYAHGERSREDVGDDEITLPVRTTGSARRVFRGEQSDRVQSYCSQVVDQHMMEADAHKPNARDRHCNSVRIHGRGSSDAARQTPGNCPSIPA